VATAALLQEGAEPMPTTPEEHATVIDREETKQVSSFVSHSKVGHPHKREPCKSL
jgi:hypothetical protein